MPDRNLQNELAEAARHWNAIEKRLKEAEQTTLDVVTPAINELRYAGRQLVDAMAIYVRNPAENSPEWTTCLNHVTVARQYLVNADHDITDAVGLWLNIRISNMIDQFGLKFLEKHIPEFDAMDKKLKELQGIIATSRENRSDRANDYKRAATTLIPDLLKLFNLISMAEVIGVAHERKWATIGNFGFWFGIAGSAASLLSIILAWDQIRAFFMSLFN